MLLILAGCNKTEPLRIGAKDFTEQYILAEIIAQLLEHEKIPVKRFIPYGDTFANLEAIKNNELDIYVEYNGTGLIMLGRPPINDGNKAFIEVKKLFKSLGLEWQNRLGFANNYVLLMRRDRALALKINKISELVKIGSNIKMGMEPEFMERPLDGLSALKRRYGLPHIIPTVVNNDKSIIYQALLDGKIDVLEGFSTEGRIKDFGLVILEDDLEFFPVYEPSPLVRADALKKYPQLQAIFQKLAGIIDVHTMQEMNREVELEGQNYKTVAQSFLIKNQLISKLTKINKTEELVIAAGMLNELGRDISKALRAVRKSFPGRRVQATKSINPLQLLKTGEARLGILSAEAFFTIDAKSGLPIPNQEIEAIGVIGNKMAHIIALNSDKINSIADIKELGVSAENSASARTAEMILPLLNLNNQVQLNYHQDLNQQINAVKDGKLDALFLMAPLGHEQLTIIMNQGIFKLISLPEWQQGNHLIRFPFFRLARIPINTYDQQNKLIETISSQMVLAAATPMTDIVGNRGPATVISASVQPLPSSAIIQLSNNLITSEKLDPTLPLSKVLKPETQSLSSPINPSKIESFFNFLMILAIFFFLYLFFRKSRA